MPIRDPDLESFLAVSRARLAPRTVESYRRDLEDFAGKLGRGIADAGSEEIETYLADLRAAGRSGSSGPRSTSTSGSSAVSARVARNGSSRSGGGRPRRCAGT